MGGPLGTARVRVAPILSRLERAVAPGLPHAGRVQPLIVTLTLDEASQERFDALRRRHFPPERNHLSAHVTLFHAVPGELEAQVRRDLETAAQRPPLELRVTGPRSLGRGVAYDLVSPELVGLRQALAAGWQPHLTNQDRQWHRPHVTVQNKVTPEQARRTLQALPPDEATATGTGLALWRYLGPSWEALADTPFSGPERVHGS